MKIAIHHKINSFSDRWIAYCTAKNIEYCFINIYDTNIVSQVYDCDALFFHYHQSSTKDIILAKPVLFALQQSGIKVFPDFNTAWHFDDKVGQKYLLEAIGSPLVPSYVFVEKQRALEWVEKTTFPKVFKLRRGAGSKNVKLVKTKAEGKKLVKKAFGQGFSNYNKFGSIKERTRKWSLGKTNAFDVLKGFVRLIAPPLFSRILGREIGYVYFQDFIPNNNHDIRVIVIGDKAFAIKRMVRKNDFRASGSGHILYEKENFRESDIKLAFEIHDKLKSQCTAMDFVYDNGQPKLVEISYGFSPEGYDLCPGYWDKNLNWHEEKFDPYGWMVEEVLSQVAQINE